ncbi:MAG: hypothetical protein H0V88_12775, partial [Pyrinomonadaceae bacterium]|nr:hypothetical protein [Pyrinomonadaceae bacterium]
MTSRSLKLRTALLIAVESALLYGCVVAAAYLRLGANGAYEQLSGHHGYYKAGVATLFCIGAFYLYDLYDFARMHDRRELVLRLAQALGLAWVALAFLFYAVPRLAVGRGVSLITLPLASCCMLAWRAGVHWLMGHPNVGERILIVGSGESAVEIAREALERRDAGYRVIGFVDNDPELVGRSLINPRVIGLTSELEELTRREKIDRIVVSIAERRGQFPINQLLDLSLSGNVVIE